MARKKVRKLSKKEAKAELKVAQRSTLNAQRQSESNLLSNVERQALGAVEVPPVLTVREFAASLKVPVTEVIAKLVQNGVMATINELIDFETMAIIAQEIGFELKKKAETEAPAEIKESKKHLVLRPPVVTVMGHVDHGKTAVLDAIRHTNIMATESGGITQHIGAYQIYFQKEGKERKITFLDTPGHEAFSAMRAHGANITDIVVLVVAADDGVKPQTVEAIHHAKAAGVAIVVAINKIDLPAADVDRVKRQLAEQGLNPEEWGGEMPMVPVSAKTGQNIDELLEMILLVADLKELKADPTLSASGVVVESHMQAGRGPIATVLVQEGTLRLGDVVVIGQTYGKIRIMENYLSKKISEAGPSMPVRLSGLQEVPNFGDRLIAVTDEKEAKELTKVKTIKRKVLSISDLAAEIKAGRVKELRIILKADVAGSLEALKKSLNDIATEEVKINLLHEGVGDVSESDVHMAIASQALVLGFRVKASPDVLNLAKREKVKISIYEIIYQLIDDISAALSGLLEPEIVEVELGRLQVLAVFRTSKNEKIIGGKVTSGKIVNNYQVRIVRDKETVGTGKILNLQQNKRDAAEVLENFEAGLKVETPTKILVGDSLECFRQEERVRKLGQ